MTSRSEEYFYNVTQVKLSMAQRDFPLGIGWRTTLKLKNREFVNYGLASETELWEVVPEIQDAIIEKCRLKWREKNV